MKQEPTHTYTAEELADLEALAAEGARLGEHLQAERERIGRMLMATDFDPNLGQSVTYECGKALVDGGNDFDHLTPIGTLRFKAQELREWAEKNEELIKTLTNPSDIDKLREMTDGWIRQAAAYDQQAEAMEANRHSQGMI